MSMEFTSTGTEYIDEFFAHHGIKGQKWGIRRYQNEDGTLTEAGKKRYNKITEHYKNDKGEFSTRKSTKASALTAVTGSATGLGLTLAGLPIVGIPVAAASGAAAIAGAIKREKARRYLENTGTGNIKDISLDRRYATNFDFFGLGAIINTAYGTHREKVAEKVMNELKNTKMSDIKAKKKVAHSDMADIMFSFDDLSSSESLEHWGIFGMKWGRRRYQNPDGSLTPEGRVRYLKGGDKEIKKAEKERARRQAILSDRKKLFKHRNEFSKAEIDKAMEKFIAEDQLKFQIESEKDARRQAKIEAKRTKEEYKRLKAQAKFQREADKLKQELQKAEADERQKQAEIKTKSDKLALESKKETSDIAAAASKWKERANKASNMFEFAKVGHQILSDMGIISKDGSESLFGALAESMGIKDTSAKKAAEEAKKARELMKEKASAASAIKELYSSKNTAYAGLTKDQMDNILRKAGLAEFIV